MFIKAVGVVLILVFYNVITAQSIYPVVRTNIGLVKGLKADDGNYSMFLGIPYGKVNETNPFGAATPYPKFEKTVEAFSDSPVCPQVEEFKDTVAGSLDCLILNVYVPSSASSEKLLPVLVWIYGGGYVDGDASRYLYGPKFLVNQDIILVSINYRLGPYGFMCLHTPEIPGNQGLKDQLLALRWINKNIEAFGGDANKITISGQSAGAISVGMHLHSNNELLYHQAILQSGTAMNPHFMGSTGEAPTIIAEHFGFKTNNVADAVNFISKLNSHLVIAAVNQLDLHRFFRPCIEKKFEGVESFVTENWVTSAVPKVKNMSILFGYNNDESHYMHMAFEGEYYKENNIIHNLLALAFNVDDEGFREMEHTVNHFYFGDQPLGVSVKRDIINFDSDFTVYYPTYRSIARYLENGAKNIFLYLFSYGGERNFFKTFFNYTSATHSDELGYLFDISYMKDKPVTQEDEMIINRMTTIWANFVKFGNPLSQTSNLLQTQWPPITSLKQIPYLNIDSQISIQGRPFKQRIHFWELFYKANEKYQRYNT